MQLGTLFTNSQPMQVAMALLLFGSLAAFDSNYFMPQEFKWVLIVATAALLLIVGAFRTARDKVLAFDHIDLCLLAFTAYAVLSLAWSPDPRGGGAFLLCWLAVWVIFTHFKNVPTTESRSWLFGAVSLAAIFVLVVYHVKPETWWSGFHNENFAAEFLLLALPFVTANAVIHWHSKILRLSTAGLLLWMLFYLFWQNPSKVEFFVLPITGGLIGFMYLLRKFPRIAILLAVALPASVAMLVWREWDGANGFAESLLPRLGMGYDTLLIWLRQPIFGSGAGSFRYLFPEYQDRYLENFSSFGPVIRDLAHAKFRVVGAAHNDVLQFLSEFGLVGAFLVFLLAYWVFKGIKQNEPTLAARVGLAALAIVLANALIEFPLQNPATAVLAAVAAGLVANAARLPRLCRVEGGVFPPFVPGFLLLVSGALIFAVWRMDGAEREHRLVVRYYNSIPSIAFDHTLEANRLNPLAWRVRVQLYESLLHWNRWLGFPPLPPDEYDRVFATARTAGPQVLLLTRRLQYLLDTQRFEEKKEEVDSSLAYLKRNFPRNPDVWIADAYREVLTGHPDLAQKALSTVRNLPLNAEQQQQVLGLESMLGAGGK